jgi:hypothetical protein
MTTKWTQDQTMTAISQRQGTIIEVQLDIISPTTFLRLQSGGIEETRTNVRQGDGFG